MTSCWKVLELAGNPAAALLPLDAPGTPYRALRDCAERFEREVPSPPTPTPTRARGEPALHPAASWSCVTAGHETTFSALSWTLALLAQHPDVLAALTDEVAPCARGELDPEALRALPLLDAVIRGPRFHLVAEHEPGVARRGHPRGAMVIFSIHMAALYPEPARFDPGRWAGCTLAVRVHALRRGAARLPRGGVRVEMAALLARLLPRVWPEIPDGIALDARLRITAAAAPGTARAVAARPRRARVRGTFNDCVTVGARAPSRGAGRCAEPRVVASP